MKAWLVKGAWNTSLPTLSSFVRMAAIAVLFSAGCGAVAHLIAAQIATDLYLVAIGDHVLPASPTESRVFGPLFIGAYVSWWLGLAATPVILAIAGGSRLRWSGRAVCKAVVLGVFLQTCLLGGLMILDGPRDDVANAFLLCLLDRGYLILIAGLLVVGIALRASSRS